MRVNVRPANPHRTYEGAPAIPPRNALAELRRAVSSCLLWEGQFYEDGVAIADRIKTLVAQCAPADVAALAIEARSAMNLRHAPLWLLTSLAAAGHASAVTADGYASIMRRADEMGELLALYWKDGKRPIPAAMKRGLARSFARFDEYSLAKYDRKSAVTLRDVLRLVHPKPADEAQAALWKRVIDGTLATPDTWEVALSAGADKRETWERLLREGNLGYLALLRNLRNMQAAGVDADLVRTALLARKGAHRVFPFRYVAAARAAPMYEPVLDTALCAAIGDLQPLTGTTAVLVDVSGSMNVALSSKSDMTRMDAACALASILPGTVRMFSFSHQVIEVPPRRGMAGVDALRTSQSHGGTYLGAAVQAVNQQIPHDRLIVITDEQSADSVPPPVAERAYMINVAAYKNGVGYGRWMRIDGFSENIFRYIREHESTTHG